MSIGEETGYKLTREDLEWLLEDGERIPIVVAGPHPITHTWHRDALISAGEKCGAWLADTRPAQDGFGVLIQDNNGDRFFCATKTGRMKALHAEIRKNIGGPE